VLDTVDQFFFNGTAFASSAGRVTMTLLATVRPQLSDGQAVPRIDSHELGTTPGRSAWASDFSELTVTR